MEVPKLINKKQIILFTLLATLQFLFANNLVFGYLLAVSQILFIMSILIFKKSVIKAFYWHVFFMFTSIEGTNVINGIGKPIYGYRTIRIPIISISFSNLIPILLIILLILSKKKMIVSKKDLSYKFISFFFILPFSLGIIRLATRSYDLGFFVNSLMQPFIYLVVYTLLFQYISNETYSLIKLKKLIVTSLMGSVFSTNIASFFGVTSYYGGSEVIPTNNLMFFAPFLIILSLYTEKKEQKLIFLTGIISIINIAIFDTSGKSILFSIFAIMIFLYKNITNKRRFYFIVILIFVILIPSFLFSSHIFQKIEFYIGNNNLIRAKMKQFVGLIRFMNWGEDFKNVPLSPRLRILESVNIYLTHKENYLDLFFGSGFGGYFKDIKNYFNGINLQGAFDEKQIKSGQFVSPHESINEVFLYTGFFGVLFWLFILFKFSFFLFKDNEYSFFAGIGLLFIGIFWNTFVILSYLGLVSIIILENNKEL